MKAEQILLQLFKKLPQYSPYFSTITTITSLVLNTNIVTATTANPHNLILGQSVNITWAIIKNPIVSLTQVPTDEGGYIATGITQFDHDLTEDFNENVEIIGADQSDYNGTHPLLTVPNRRTFTFSVMGNPITPATG